MSHLFVYTTPTCVRCRAVMRQLDKDGITYTKIDVTEDAEAAERLRRNGFTEAPVFGFAGKLKTIADLPEIRKQILSNKEAA